MEGWEEDGFFYSLSAPTFWTAENRSLCLFDPRWRELCATKAGIKWGASIWLVLLQGNWHFEDKEKMWDEVVDVGWGCRVARRKARQSCDLDSPNIPTRCEYWCQL